MTIFYRRACANDNAQARGIVRHSLAQFGIDADFDGLDASVGMLGLAESTNQIELLALHHSTVCACVVIKAINATQGKLFGFHVDPTFRGQGIGKTLLRQAIEMAIDSGLQRLELHTWDSMHAAIHLYQALGWQRIADPAPESGANRAYELDLSHFKLA